MAFTAVIQLGSIAAVVWYFWQDLIQITTGAIKAVQKSDYHLNTLHGGGYRAEHYPDPFCGTAD